MLVKSTKLRKSTISIITSASLGLGVLIGLPAVAHAETGEVKVVTEATSGTLANKFTSDPAHKSDLFNYLTPAPETFGADQGVEFYYPGLPKVVDPEGGTTDPLRAAYYINERNQNLYESNYGVNQSYTVMSHSYLIKEAKYNNIPLCPISKVTYRIFKKPVISSDYSSKEFIWEGVAKFAVDPADVTAGAVCGTEAKAETPAAKTSAPTIGNPDTITEGTDVALKLNLDLNAKLASGTSLLSGAGLLPSSEFKLIMQSDPVVLYTGTSDPSGNFNTNFDFTQVACPGPGVHTLTLAGIKPDGSQTKAVAKMLLDSNCVAKAIVQGGLSKTLSFGGILFPIHSPRLTSQSMKNLKEIAPLLKDAKRITLTGYTQTNYRSKATIPGSKRLAKKRAVAVSKYLQKLGVNTTVTIVGNGPVDPVSLKKQKLNRRVEISVGFTS